MYLPVSVNISEKIILDPDVAFSGLEQSTGNRKTWVRILAAIEDLFFREKFVLK